MITKFEFKPFNKECIKDRFLPIENRNTGSYDPESNKYMVFSKKEIIEKLRLENNREELPNNSVLYTAKDTTLINKNDTVYFYDLFNKDFQPFWNSQTSKIVKLNNFQLDFIEKNFDKFIQYQITTVHTNHRCNILIVD